MRKIPKPKCQIRGVIVGHCHPHSADTIMIEVTNASYDSQYGHWVYMGMFRGKEVEIYEHDIDYSFISF